MRHKFIEFSFDLPITSLKKGQNSMWSSIHTGSITVFGRGKYLNGPASDLPGTFQTGTEKEWIDLTITGVHFMQIDILPVFAGFKECNSMLAAIKAAAYNNCLSIYQEKYAK